MRALLLACLIACSGTDEPNRQVACQHVCSCFTFSTANGQTDCVTQCSSSTGSKGPKLASNQQCYSCAAVATCGAILSGSACQSECATAP